jgi:hypothetical protein
MQKVLQSEETSPAITMYPEFFRSELKCPSETVKHFVTDERKKGE